MTLEILSASEIRIRDINMAQEMVQFTRSPILSQAGHGDARTRQPGPQGVLQLLR